MDASPQAWYASPEWWLVIVGFLTIAFIWYQAIQAARASRAAEKSISLQSVQWVTLKGWKNHNSSPYTVVVQVDIVNETGFPLTLSRVVFQVGTTKFDSTEDVTVVPQASHTVAFVRQLLEEEWQAYISPSGTTFGLRGAIRFDGIAGKRIQHFGGLVTASSSATKFSARSEYEHSAKEHYREEPPN